MVYFYIKSGKKTVASPKKIKNPNTSVNVVRKIDEAMAGSIFILSKTSGMRKPMEQAIIMLAIMAKNKINPK